MAPGAPASSDELSRPILDPSLGAAAAEAASVGLCLHCLGRCFAKVDTGFGNDERGKMLAELHGLTNEVVEPGDCHVCEGLFEPARIEELTDVVEDTLATVEFASFLVGTRVDFATHEREAVVWKAAGCERTEGINSELNREIGKRLVERHEETLEVEVGDVGGASLPPSVPRRWDVDFKRPEVTALLDTRFDHVSLTFRSLYVYGRYTKHTRGIPQTHWPCRRCRGSGCLACEKTGKQYETSVEEEVEGPFLAASGATEAKFHGSGREDVDALCLGTGRPFILEMVDPRVRRLDLATLERVVNEAAAPHVAISGLKFVDQGAVERVKASKTGKAYAADVRFDEVVSAETLLNACHILTPARVAQRTPSRVSHRRADKVRKRMVHEVRVLEHAPDARTARLRIEGDAGLYIKELLSGDNGRTEPSLADLVGTGARCTALDVVRVDAPPGLEDGPA